jgi:hypothetical protein
MLPDKISFSSPRDESVCAKGRVYLRLSVILTGRAYKRLVARFAGWQEECSSGSMLALALSTVGLLLRATWPGLELSM